MNRNAAVAAVQRQMNQVLEIAGAAVRCGGSCGGLRRLPESRAISMCGGSAPVAAWCPPYPLCASRHFGARRGRMEEAGRNAFLGYQTSWPARGGTRKAPRGSDGVGADAMSRASRDKG
jgi:hypothetical protein